MAPTVETKTVTPLNRHRRQKGPTATARAAKARKDAAYTAKVRADVIGREAGICRAWNVGIGECCGDVGWAHMEGHRRFETRGLPPEQRHSTAWTLLLCAKHHADYDARRLRITGNADGPLEFVRSSVRRSIGKYDPRDVALLGGDPSL